MFFTKLYIVAITLVALFFFTPANAQTVIPLDGWTRVSSTMDSDTFAIMNDGTAPQGNYFVRLSFDGTNTSQEVTWGRGGFDVPFDGTLKLSMRGSDGFETAPRWRITLSHGDTTITSEYIISLEVWGGVTLSELSWSGSLSRFDSLALTATYMLSGSSFHPLTLDMDNIRLGDNSLIYSAGDVGIIQGSVFNDTSGNSSREPGEDGLAGMVVYLTGAQNDSVMTDSLGNYKFSDLPHGSYTVTSPSLPGFTQTMPMSGSYNVTIGPDTLFYIGDFGNYATSAMGFPVEKGWNLMSLPLDVPDASVTTLYPTAITAIYGFNGSYYEVDTMVRGYAVWGKFAHAQNVWLNGDTVTADTVEVLPGWNAIGGLTEPVLVSEITTSSAELTTGYFWEWRNNGYRVADTLVAGRGYWVSVSIAGSLMLQANIPDGVTTFRLRVAPDGEMPPTPPGGDVAVDLPTVAPSEFQLAQNYPNPFNPTTRISYDVPRAGNVRLVIYNLMGQEVATLVNEAQAEGNYEVEFNASDLPSGIYIYRLTAAGFTATNKMILLK